MMVTWITRAQSGLVAPNPRLLSPRVTPVVGITKHHTASQRPASAEASRALWRELQAEAMSGNNPNRTFYGDIEYNLGFDDFGQVLIGRDNGVNGAHATSTGNVANDYTLGVAYLGGFVVVEHGVVIDDGQPRAQAWAALDAIFYVTALAIHHAPLDFGHTDWTRYGGIVTDCPGPALEHSHP